MRKFPLLAILAVLAAFGSSMTSPAEAGERYYRGREPVVVHYGYYPRYRNVYVTERYVDPYSYRYEPRGYYPYYNSGYWKPAWVLRQRGRKHYVHPPYYAAWGYPDRSYHHRAWHARHDGRVHIGHW